MQDNASRCSEVERETENVDENWDFDGMVSVGEEARAAVRNNLNKI